MKATLVFPFPLVGCDAHAPEMADARAVFAPFARRFVETYLKFPPGGDHDLAVVFGGEDGTNDDESIFNPLEGKVGVRFARYDGAGVDIGTAQFAAKNLNCGEFIVGMTSRVYFHRAGALQRLLDAREKYGRGLYGACGTFERCPLSPERFPNPHIRTVWYGMDADDFRRYPYEIVDRDTSYAFESGRWNFADWFWDRQLPVKMCTWNKEYDREQFRALEIKNCFRRGDQSDCLVWDKHSDAYRDAAPQQKREMAVAAGDKLVRAI